MRKRILGTAHERLMALVERGAPDECWEFTSPRNRHGYGRIGYQREAWLAHRLAYATWVGPIPDGAVVCHTCDNPPCCNPAHLFIGTQLDNIADMARKGRARRGERVPTSKLTEADVRAIRADTRLQSVIAADYGIDHSAVWKIQKGTRWGWVQ